MSKKKRPTLAEQLLAAVEGNDLTIKAIADRSGIPQPVLCRFANRTRTINLETADKLARFFDMRLTKPVQPS